jgi:hypothetical protein
MPPALAILGRIQQNAGAKHAQRNNTQVHTTMQARTTRIGKQFSKCVMQCAMWKSFSQ